jgi:hypothetical protein
MRNRHHGAPNALTITKMMWRPYLENVRALFASNQQHAALVAAENIMREILDPGPERRRPTVHTNKGLEIAKYKMHLELLRLQQETKRGRWRKGYSPVTPRLAVEVAVSVWLLSRERPDILPDDVRLTRAIANAIYRLMPLARTERWDQKRNRSILQHRPPGAWALDALGTRIRERLGVFVLHVERAIEERKQLENRNKSDIREPFPSVARNATE